MEMTKKLICLLIFQTLLVGCSSSSFKLEDQKKAFELFKDSFSSKQDMYKVYDSKEINKINYPVVEIRTNGFVKQDLMLPISTRKKYVNYLSGRGNSATFEEYFLTKTNGFNVGLISLSQTDINLLADKSSYNTKNKHQKEYTFINTDYKANTYKFVCNLKYGSTQQVMILDVMFMLHLIYEECKNDKYSFVNEYFLDEENFVWKSKQWAPVKNIFFEITTLKKDY